MNLTIEALGAAPAEITMGDIYVALDRGTTDATISSLSSLRSYKLDELAKAASTNANFGTFTNVFSIAADKWNGSGADAAFRPYVTGVLKCIVI